MWRCCGLIVCMPLEQVVWGQALPGNVVLCSWARHLTLTVPISTQVYKMGTDNLMLGETLWWTRLYTALNFPILICYWILEQADRIASELDSSAKQTTWQGFFMWFTSLASLPPGVGAPTPLCCELAVSLACIEN